MKKTLTAIIVKEHSMKTRQTLVYGIFAVILVLTFAACDHESPAHVHQWGDWELTNPATCITEGEKTRICALNAAHTETQEIPIDPDAHDWIAGANVSVQPTCTEEGIGTRGCTRCDLSEPSGVIPALGHDWEWVTITAATETADGSETQKCKHDNTHTNMTRTAYATGTPGLAFEAIGTTAYRVRKGAVTSGEVHIPAYRRPNDQSNYQPVTEIGSTSDNNENGAFYNTSVTSITIPANVTLIGSNVFSSCTSLTSITVDSDNPNYTSEGGILYNKAKTTLIQAPPAGISGAITILDSVTSISDSAFKDCSNLTTVTFTEGSQLQTIGNSAFQDCIRLTTVTFATGSQLQTIGNSAFQRCNDQSINGGGIAIPASVTSIGDSAFLYARFNSITIAAGSQLQTIGVSAFHGYLHPEYGSISNMEIPASVTSIGDYAFAGAQFTNLTFAAGSQLQTIGYAAFQSCQALTSITIPASVTSIGFNVFSACMNLASITVDVGNPNYASEGGILYNNAKTTLITAPAGISGAITIPDSVTSISQGAFIYCRNLTSVSIPNSVTAIGNSAFMYWGSTQMINVLGHTSEAAADAAWGEFWRWECSAIINYLGQ